MDACWSPYDVPASKALFADRALSKTLWQGVLPTNRGDSPLGLLEPPANFLLPTSSVIERLAIPATTFSLFPSETSTAHDHDDGIPNSMKYVSVGFSGDKAEKGVSAGSSKADSGEHNSLL